MKVNHLVQLQDFCEIMYNVLIYLKSKIGATFFI